MIAFVLLVAQLIHLASGASSWDEVSHLESLDPASLNDFLSPILQVTSNTYRFPKVRAVPGWSLATRIKPLAPENGGAHALVYKEEDGDRLVLGFRGTDLTDLLDKCADIELFGSIPPYFGANASDCVRFSSDALDYYGQAVKYTKQVVTAYPESKILLTGHSLGGSLASLMSAFWSTTENTTLPVVSFSAPPVRSVFARKGVGIKHDLVYNIGDEWDVLIKPLAEQVGNVCLYEGEQPVNCRACEISDDLGMCSSCFSLTHYLKHIITLVQNCQAKPACVHFSMLGGQSDTTSDE